MKTTSLYRYILSIGIWMLMVFVNQVIAQTAFKLGVGGAMSSTSHSIIDYKLQPSFSVDARTVLRLGKKLELEAGLSLNQKASRYVIEEDEIRWPDQHNGNGGFDPELEGENIEKAKSIDRNFHVEVPIQLNMYFKETGQGIYLHGGMRPGYGFGYQSKAIIIENGERRVSTSESMTKPKLFSLMSRVGMGIAFPVIAKGMFVEPYFEYQLNDITDPSAMFRFRIHQYGFGVLVGVRV